MKPSPKTRPIVPRKVDKAMLPFAGKAFLSPKNQAKVEAIERRRDAEFARRFSVDELFAILKQAPKLCTEVPINSQNDFDADRAAASLRIAFEDAVHIGELVDAASPIQLRWLRWAFEAGESWAEARAYNGGPYRGRPRKDRLAQAEKAMAELPPGAPAKEALYRWPGKDVPNPKRAANLVSDLRKLSRKP